MRRAAGMKIQKGRARKRRGARLRCGGLGGAGISAAADCELMDVRARCGRFQEEECWLQEEEQEQEEEEGSGRLRFAAAAAAASKA